MFTLDFFCRYGLLLAGSLLLLRMTYYRISPNREAFFSFFIFANGVFIVTYLLHGVDLSMGFAFGLFAVFAMLRYRTETISIRDMTYLFVIIGLALMCAVAKISFIELGALMILINLLAAAAESSWLTPKNFERKVIYDKIDLITPEQRPTLIADLETRMGVKVEKVDIGRVDYLSDSALITVYCKGE